MGGGIDLDRAVTVLTGGSSGIGLEAAKRLADSVELLIVHGVGPAPPGLPASAIYIEADYRRLEAVTELSHRIAGVADRVDVLINNAGIPGPAEYTETLEGHEVTYQVNLLAGALLTDRLVGLIPSGGRILNLGSSTHYSASLDPDDPEHRRARYSPAGAYAHSKLAITTYTGWLARRLAPGGQDVVSVHPGVIATDLLHAMFGNAGARVELAGQVLFDLAGRPLRTGAYYDEQRVATPSPQALDPATQEWLARYVTSVVGHPRPAPVGSARRRRAATDNDRIRRRRPTWLPDR